MEASVLLIVIVIAVIVLLVKSDTGNIRYQQFLHAQELEELKALVERALAEMASMKAESPAANASPAPTTEESGAKAPETEPNQTFRLENEAFSSALTGDEQESASSTAEAERAMTTAEAERAAAEAREAERAAAMTSEASEAGTVATGAVEAENTAGAVEAMTAKAETAADEGFAEGEASRPVPPPIPSDYLERVSDEDSESADATENYNMPDYEDSEEEHETGNNWEKFVGENLFSKIGILVLIIGIGFFVKYAIDKNWINEAARTCLGMATGFLLWGIAYHIRDSYRKFSSILAGGGFAVCFVTMAIAFNLYNLLSPTLTFAILVALTAAMTGFALRYDRKGIAVTAIIGGFTAPFIARSSNYDFTATLIYMAILDSAVLAIANRKNWWTLTPLSCWLTYITCGIGVLASSADTGIWLAAIFYYFAIFAVSTVIGIERNREMQNATLSLVSAFVLNAIVFIALSSSEVDSIDGMKHIKGLPALAGAAVTLLLFAKKFRTKPGDFTGNLLIVATAGLVLSSVLVQFSSVNICMTGAGLEAAAFTWLYTRSGRKVFKALSIVIGAPLAAFMILDFFGNTAEVFGRGGSAWGYIVTGIAFMSASYALLLHAERITEKDGIADESDGYMRLAESWAGACITAMGANILFWNLFPPTTAQGLTLCVEAALMFAFLLAGKGKRVDSTYYIVPGLTALLVPVCALPESGNLSANLALIAALVLFGAVYFRLASDVYRKHRFVTKFPEGYMAYFNVALAAFVVSVTYLMLEMASASHLFNAGMSIALTLCATAQMILGMRNHSKPLRIIALGVFGMVIFKLVVNDLWLMAPIGRIIVFILLGVILLAISFLYQKLRAALFEE